MSGGLHRQGVLPVSLEESPEDGGSTPPASSNRVLGSLPLVEAGVTTLPARCSYGTCKEQLPRKIPRDHHKAICPARSFSV